MSKKMEFDDQIRGAINSLATRSIEIATGEIEGHEVHFRDRINAIDDIIGLLMRLELHKRMISGSHESGVQPLDGAIEIPDTPAGSWG